MSARSKTLKKSPRSVPQSSKKAQTESTESFNLQNECIVETICAACRTPITDVIVQALNQSWHEEHFVCTHCEKPIKSLRFNVHDGYPYCEEDYAKLFLKKCFKCNEPIKDVVIMASNKAWHREHFICSSCSQTLAHQGYYERNNLPLCQECYERLYCPPCTECKKPITETAIIALGAKYHQNCFRCNQCKKTITDCTFEMFNSEKICSGCVPNYR